MDNKNYQQTGSSENRLNPITDYQIFNPEQLDSDQWIKAIKKAGFKFAILTATCEMGFALYPSNINPYSVQALTDGEWKIIAKCKSIGHKRIHLIKPKEIFNLR